MKVKVGLKGFDSLLNALSDGGFQRAGQEAMKEALDAGAGAMKDVVATRGTNKQWASSWFSSSQGWRDHSSTGRVDSGAMRDRIQAGPISGAGNKVFGSFGWVEGSPEYALFQEYGFKHVLTNQVIEGMESMIVGADRAGDAAVDALVKNLQIAIGSR